MPTDVTIERTVQTPCGELAVEPPGQDDDDSR